MTKKEYRKDDRKPSDMFMNALSGYGVGSDELTCGWCGRVHLCPDNNYDERDNMDRDQFRAYCEEEKAANPDGVVLHYDCDGVSAHEMNGIMFVLDCPCNGLSRYETFIWAHKDTIRNYLKTRIEQEHKWAEEQLTLNKLAGI